MLLVRSTLLFWIFAVTLGLFVGPAQAAARSYLARRAPEHLQGGMFGLMAFSGKVTAFVGPALVGWITYWTDSLRAGMATIVAFITIALLVMLMVPAAGASRQDVASGDPHRA